MNSQFIPQDSQMEHYAKVIDSFQLSDGRIPVFLYWVNAQLPEGIVLEDSDGNTWKVMRRVSPFIGIDAYEENKIREAQHIFQYTLQKATSNGKPLKDQFLRITYHPG